MTVARLAGRVPGRFHRPQAPPMARLYVGASDEEQAQELIDAGMGLVERTPELAGQFRTGELEITCARNGASVRALTGDASAMGKRAWMLTLDEVANWPETRKARRFWGVLTSGNRKIADCRTVVITNAGDPDALGVSVTTVPGTALGRSVC